MEWEGVWKLRNRKFIDRSRNENQHKGQFKYLNKTLDDFKKLKTKLKMGSNYLYHFLLIKIYTLRMFRLYPKIINIQIERFLKF